MNTNKPNLAVYKSQASQKNHLAEPIPKLYTSGANLAPTHRSPYKYTLEQPNAHRQPPKKERVIDSQSNLTRQTTALYRGSALQRSKSGQPVKWQSPTKQNICGESFKSIIEEINEQNQKTFSKLDQDLKRIKNNLNRVEQESVQAHQYSQNQVLSQEIQLLQQQNQRLREKNQSLINEKKKMSQQIDHYQSLIQRQKIKQMTSLTTKISSQEGKSEQLMNNLRKFKSQLQQRQGECQKLKSINSQLSNAKVLSQKRQSLLSQEKSKLLLKLAEIQKQKDMIQLRYQEQLKKQLQKKDIHYTRMLKSQQNKYQETIIKLKETVKKSVNVHQASQTIQSLSLQIKKLKDHQEHFKKEVEKLRKSNGQYCQKFEGLNNQIEVLSFSYKQTYQQLAQQQQNLNQYKQINQKLQVEINKCNAQIAGLRLKLEEENKKSSYLQQFCTTIQRQSEQHQYEAKNSQAHLNEAIRIHSHEVQKYRVALESVKEENCQLQRQVNQLNKINDKHIAQIRKKAQEIICLKKENLMLTSETQNLKTQNAVSPQKYQVSPQPSHYRLQRLHSARQSRQQNDMINHKQKEISKMRKMERQLNDLISECKLQNEKSKIIFRQKEVKYQNSISQQKQQIEDLTHRIQQLNKDSQAKSIEITNQQQLFKDALRKKDDQYTQQQRKYAQMGLKISLSNSQNHQLKKKVEQFTMKQLQFNHNDCLKKVQQAKQQSKRMFDIILNQIVTLTNSSQYQSQLARGSLHIGLRQIKTYEQVQKMAQINFAMHNLRQKIKGLHSKIKQYSQSSKRIDNHHSFILDKSSLVQQNHKSQTLIKHYNQQSSDVEKRLLKASEIQKKYQRQSVQLKEQTKEIQQLHEEIRLKKRQISRLKNQVQTLEDEKEELKIKNRSLQQRFNKRQPYRKEQPYQKQVDFITPTKQSTFYRPSYIQADRQAQQNKLRSRVRSFRSCDKREANSQGFKDYQRKIAQLEANLARATRQLANKQERIEQLEKEKADILKKEKKCQSKYQSKIDEFEELQQMLQQEVKVKTQLQSKINELQHQLKVLVHQIDTLNHKHLKSDFYQRSILQQQYRQTINQKEYAIKKLRGEISQKQGQIASAIQQNEARITEMMSQHNRRISQIGVQLQAFKQQNEQLLTKIQRKEQRISRSELQISQLRQKVERQQKEKQSMLSIFSNNTNRLTKMLQQKQIQIEQLKFIQQSTIINSQYGRSRRKKNDNSFSFKQQF